MKLTPYIKIDDLRAYHGLYAWVSPQTLREMKRQEYDCVKFKLASCNGDIFFCAEILTEQFIDSSDILFSETIFNGIPLLCDATMVEVLCFEDDKLTSTSFSTDDISVSLHPFFLTPEPSASQNLTPESIIFPFIPHKISSFVLPSFVKCFAKNLVICSGMLLPVTYLSKTYVYCLQVSTKDGKVPNYNHIPFQLVPSTSINISELPISFQLCQDVTLLQTKESCTASGETSPTASYSVFDSELQLSYQQKLNFEATLNSSPSERSRVLKNYSLLRKSFQQSSVSDAIFFFTKQLRIPVQSRKLISAVPSSTLSNVSSPYTMLSLLLPTFLIVGDTGLGKTYILRKFAQCIRATEATHKFRIVGESFPARPEERQEEEEDDEEEETPQTRDSSIFQPLSLITLNLKQLLQQPKPLNHNNTTNSQELDGSGDKNPLIDDTVPVIPASVISCFQLWNRKIEACMISFLDRCTELTSCPESLSFLFLLDDIDTLDGRKQDAVETEDDGEEVRVSASPTSAYMMEYLASLPQYFLLLQQKYCTGSLNTLEVRFCILATATSSEKVPLIFTTNGLFHHQTALRFPSLPERTLISVEIFKTFLRCIPTDSNGNCFNITVSRDSPELDEAETLLSSIAISDVINDDQNLMLGLEPKLQLELKRTFELIPKQWILFQDDSGCLSNLSFLQQNILPIPHLFSLFIDIARLGAGETPSSLSFLLEKILHHSISTNLVPSYAQISPTQAIITIHASQRILDDHKRYMSFLQLRKGFIAPKSVFSSASFDNFSGYRTLLNDCGALVDQWKQTKSVSQLGVPLPSGILFTGPSGVGKTHLAHAVANGTGFEVVSLSCADVFQKYLGESEKVIRETFRRARLAAPCVVLIDQLETIAPNRAISSASSTGVENRILSTLLNELDGVEERNGVYVIATAREKKQVDAALMRPGRLDRVIQIDLPTEDSRVAIFDFYSKNMQFQDNATKDKCRQIVILKHDLSSSDIKNICSSAISIARRYHLNMKRFTNAAFKSKQTLQSPEADKGPRDHPVYSSVIDRAIQKTVLNAMDTTISTDYVVADSLQSDDVSDMLSLNYFVDEFHINQAIIEMYQTNH